MAAKTETDRYYHRFQFTGKSMMGNTANTVLGKEWTYQNLGCILSKSRTSKKDSCCAWKLMRCKELESSTAYLDLDLKEVSQGFQHLADLARNNNGAQVEIT
jgi:hypothetical protein